ncbi:MAG: ABC transporter ATP-binding protein [Terriglobales bacterium]|jgi:ABC-type polysaccharide/polyol phosphate transport system ATPase subunit
MFDSPGLEPSIIFESVEHRYRVILERRDTLREAFVHWFKKGSHYKEFTVLRDFSLMVFPGETVGIIGRNGSGKSTVLKLIAGIFLPAEGTIRVRGQVASLIELGAGFHPELTGRENIELNGLLLGLSKREIAEREQSIIEFAELGDFMDVPVKQYSSGMYMRLGFSIAVEVDPDVLLVDEILAVGDAYFREKCLSRISGFRERGKTIVVVSHDTGLIEQLCDRALWIESGGIAADGRPQDVIPRYLHAAAVPNAHSLVPR